MSTAPFLFLYEVMLFESADERRSDFPILFHHSPSVLPNFPKGTKLSVENGKMEQEGDEGEGLWHRER